MTLRVGSTGAGVRQLQADLRRLGLFRHGVTGYFGDLTRAAVKAYERGHHLHVDGFVANAEARQIHAAAGRHAPAPAHPGTSAPPANYHRVKYRGVTLDVRTKVMLQRAEARMHRLGVRGRLSLSQGSFHHGAVSGDTHDGGGAVDLRVSGRSLRERRLMVKALRMEGFAAWNRFPSDGFANHIHAIAIGDRLLSAGARSQIGQYFHGRNGLRNHGRDRDASIGRPYPAWAARYR